MYKKFSNALSRDEEGDSGSSFRAAGLQHENNTSAPHQSSSPDDIPYLTTNDKIRNEHIRPHIQNCNIPLCTRR